MIIKSLATIFGILMSMAYFSQAHVIWKNKSAKGVSVLTFIIFSLGTAIWMLYGILIHDWVITIGYTLGVVGSWMVSFLIFWYRDTDLTEGNPL